MPSQYTPRVPCVCMHCGKTFSRQPSWIPPSGRTFCSRPCFWAAKRIIDLRAYLLERRRVDPETGCWIYTGTTDQDGYGKVQHDGQRQLVHRAALELWGNHVFMPGEFACHHCDNPPCFNPDHLYVGTHADNVQDRDDRGRTLRGNKHPRSVVTEAQARMIKGLLHDGVRACDIAREMGIKKHLVFAIKQGRSWKWLE